MPRPTAVLAALSVAVAAALAAAPAAAESFVTFQIPGALDLSPVKINNVGAITGTVVLSGKTHGFVRSPDGVVTVFDAAPGEETMPTSIGDDGTVVGYHMAGTLLHGFERDAAGNITPVTVPGGDFTAPAAINSAGVVAGLYRMAGEFTNLGFIEAPGGAAVTIAPSGTANGATVEALNDGGEAAGYFEQGLVHQGFVRSPDGTITPFDAAPPPADTSLIPQTEPIAVNNAGTVAGSYKILRCPWDCNTLTSRGFVRGADGAVAVFSVGGKRSYTAATALNNLGQTTGFYQVRRDPQKGFVRNADGSVVTFAVPAMNLTRPTSINDQGVVVGKSTAAGNQVFGFIRLP